MVNRDKSSLDGIHNAAADLIRCKLIWLFVGAVLAMAIVAIVAWEY